MKPETFEALETETTSLIEDASYEQICLNFYSATLY